MALVSTILTGVAVVSVGVGGVLFFSANRPPRTRLVSRSKPDTRRSVERSKLRGASTWPSAAPRALGLGYSDVTGCCSFVLDTEGLRKGGRVAASRAEGTNPNGGSGSLDALVAGRGGRRPNVPLLSRQGPLLRLPGHALLRRNAALHHRTALQLRLRGIQRCQSAAKKAPNPGIAAAACTMAYRNNGGRARRVRGLHADQLLDGVWMSGAASILRRGSSMRSFILPSSSSSPAFRRAAFFSTPRACRRAAPQ